MKSRDLIRKLEQDGWYLERQGKGSHQIFKHPKKDGIISVPYHGAKDMGKGLVKKILKQAGLE